jgi:hypothetical protein
MHDTLAPFMQDYCLNEVLQGEDMQRASFKKLAILVFSIVYSTMGCGYVAPTVPDDVPENVSMIDGSTDVAIDSSFVYIFSQEIDPTTVTDSTFYIVQNIQANISTLSKGQPFSSICNPDDALEAIISCEFFQQCILDPVEGLEPEMGYSICLSSDIMYLNGMSFEGAEVTFLASPDVEEIPESTEPTEPEDSDDPNETTEEANTLATPIIADIRAALGANNANGMVPGYVLGNITLPECTDGNGDEAAFEIEYSISNLPAYLVFDSSARTLSLDNTYSSIPDDAYASSSVTYTCIDSNDDSVSASIAFTINDLDGGGVVDGYEYKYRNVPLLNKSGWAWINQDNYRTYVGPSELAYSIPTGVMVSRSNGYDMMDPADPNDDTEDFDGDDGVLGGGNNAEEIVNGTNPYVYPSSANFSNSIQYFSDYYYFSTADLDRDGFLDIALSSENKLSIEIMLNNGNGTLEEASYTLLANERAGELVIASFQIEGHYDLAVQDYVNSNISIYWSRGAGNFYPQNDYYKDDHGPFGMIAGDFNRDGGIDLASIIANIWVSPNLFDVNINSGEPGNIFPNINSYGTSATANCMATADFNNDGYIDIAISTAEAPPSVEVYLNNGDGSFTWADSNQSGNNELGEIVFADFDEDGNLDMAVTVWDGGMGSTVSIFFGEGDGTFDNKTDYQMQSIFATDLSTYDIAAADFDGDGDIDLAVTLNDSWGNFQSAIGIMGNNGSGVFTRTDTITVEVPQGIEAGDFNNDGKIDIATYVGGMMTIYFNN